MARGIKMAAPQSTVRLQVSGKFACFTRPEFRAERVSYDAMTPSAARGLLESLHWKPAIRWVVDRIHVLKPVKFQPMKINEIETKISERNARTAMNNDAAAQFNIDVSDESIRVQRSSMLLRDVSYVIEAHAELTDKAGPSDTIGKHVGMFNRRLARGQCFRPPVLGLAAFPADVEEIDAIPQTEIPAEDATRDLGWMFYDYDYSQKPPMPRLFRAKMENGVIDVDAIRRGGLIT
jgi:CRISPR-associated protein Cas5d